MRALFLAEDGAFAMAKETLGGIFNRSVENLFKNVFNVFQKGEQEDPVELSYSIKSRCRQTQDDPDENEFRRALQKPQTKCTSTTVYNKPASKKCGSPH